VLHQLAAIFGANFCYVGLKAFQQLNVVHGAKLWVFVTSHLMAVVEIYLIATYAASGAAWPVILVVGTSGGLGCLFAMWLRKVVA
jgi:hypothetical protein